MNTKEIEVKYLHGIKRDDFLELNHLGFESDIPEEKEDAPAYALGLSPEDYIIIFSIYFSLKVTEELAKEQEKLQEELGEFQEEVNKRDQDKMEAEFGDVLFSAKEIFRL